MSGSCSWYQPGMIPPPLLFSLSPILSRRYRTMSVRCTRIIKTIPVASLPAEPSHGVKCPETQPWRQLLRFKSRKQSWSSCVPATTAGRKKGGVSVFLLELMGFGGSHEDTVTGKQPGAASKTATRGEEASCGV